MRRRFGVTLDPDKQILPLIGSKEGIGHVALCFIDPGDTALVPDPAYPVYAVGTMFAGGSQLHAAALRGERLTFPTWTRSLPMSHRAQRSSG